MTPTNAPAMIVLRPGDRVLVTLADDDPPEETVADVARTLRDHFPDVHFLVAAGITGIVVSPPESART